jgi:MFS family permease
MTLLHKRPSSTNVAAATQPSSNGNHKQNTKATNGASATSAASQSSVTMQARVAMFLSSFFYAMGFTVLYPTLPFFAHQLELSTTSQGDTDELTWLNTGVAYGMVMSGYGVAKIVAAPVIGHMSDRWGRRATLLWTLIGSGGCAIASSFCQSLPSLIAMRFASG